MVEEIKDLHGREAANEERHAIAPWAKGDHLRKIESEVLIPNLMKKNAKVLCKDAMASKYKKKFNFLQFCLKSLTMHTIRKKCVNTFISIKHKNQPICQILIHCKIKRW